MYIREDEKLTPAELGEFYRENLDGTEKHYDFTGSIGGEDLHNPRNPKHPGFKKVQAGIAKKMGVSNDRAGAILASSTRKSSAGAKAKNPHLKRVKVK